MCYCSVQCCHDMEKRAEKDRWKIRFGQYTCTSRPPNQNWWRLMCSSPKGGWEIMNTLECKFKCIHETELYPTKTSVIIFSVHSSCRKDAQICQMQGFSGHACPRFLNCISQLYFSTVFPREKWKMLRSAKCKAFRDRLALSIYLAYSTLILTWQPSLQWSLLSEMCTHAMSRDCWIDNWSHTTQFIRAIWGQYVQ